MSDKKPDEPAMPDADVQDESGLLTYYSRNALEEYAQAWRDTHGAQAALDCGEAGHAEGRCGNARCMRSASGVALPDGGQTA